MNPDLMHLLLSDTTYGILLNSLIINSSNQSRSNDVTNINIINSFIFDSSCLKKTLLDFISQGCFRTLGSADLI